MPSQYLTPAEAAEYGVGNATSAQIIQASALIDAYLKRPEGLVWAADSNGMPCYMAALSPQATFSLISPIAPGSNVAATLNGPIGILQTGDVLILDRANSLSEAVTITTTNPVPGQPVTLQTVINSHVAGASADYGMVIEEQRYLPKNRPITQTSRTPLMNILSGVGRYTYGRRGDIESNFLADEVNLLATLQAFGPPLWELFQPTYTQNWDPQTGQVWIPAGVLIAYYTEVKLRYVAGFQASAIPSIIKLAVAQLIQAVINMPQLGNVKSYKAGDTAITMAAASALSQDTITALQPYAARMYV